MRSEDGAALSAGFLNVLKPPGMTSARAVAFVRKQLNGAKVGHAGTLDPEAAGVLPLMIGKAARLFDDLQQDTKAYTAEIAFGAATDTQDAQGTVIQTADCVPTQQQLRALFPTLVGPMRQLPPMYSALKKDGRRLYDLAREGKTVERKPRDMTLHTLDLLRMMPNAGALIRLTCSKGFYVRTLCHDIGQMLGCPAHMRFLLRTASGAFTIANAVTLEEIDEAAQAGTLDTLLIPMEQVLAHLPAAEVPPRLIKPFLNGVPLPLGAFLALEDIGDGARVQLRMQGKTAAIARVQGELLKPATWLAE